jgi:hypothetical protein
MSASKASGKKVSLEESVIHKIKGIVNSDAKMYYIVFKYARQLLPDDGIKTFEDLRKHYAVFTPGMTETFCENWLVEERVQNAIKWLLQRLHQKKMIELYGLWFEKAKEDVQAFKTFITFSTVFFAKNSKEDLLQIVKNAKLEDDDENDDFDSITSLADPD